MLATPNKHVEIIYTTKVKTNPSNWAPLSPYEQEAEEFQKEEKHEQVSIEKCDREESQNRSEGNFGQNKKNVETELQILKVQMDERIKTAD